MEAYKSIDNANFKALWAILENSRDGIALFDIRLNRITYVTPSYTQLIGFTLIEITNLSGSEIMERIHPDDQEEFSKKYIQILTGAVDSNESMYRWRKNDGSERWILDTRILVKENSVPTFIVAICRDITKEQEQEAQIEAFLDMNMEMLCVFDREGYFVKVNKHFEEVLGYTSEELTKVSFMSFIIEEDKTATLEVLNQLNSNHEIGNFTNRYRCKDGSIKYIEWHTEPREGLYMYASARDVTQKHVNEKRLNELAIKDQLTGLYNRRFLEETILHEISHVDRYVEPISMIEYDIDLFKNINDQFGHSVGDQVLKDVSKIVSSMSRGADYLFRVGGEEFILILPHTSLDEAAQLAERLRIKIQESSHPKVGSYTCSFGVTQRILHETYEDWYNRTDAALYAAKLKGRNCVIVD